MTGALKLIKTAPHFTLTLPIQRRSQIPVLAGCGLAGRFLSLPTRTAAAPLTPSEPPDQRRNPGNDGKHGKQGKPDQSGADERQQQYAAEQSDDQHQDRKAERSDP